MFVRNGAASVRRAIESVRAQTYPNIEFLVQDAASTDGTLEILRSYGDSIKLVSEPDSGPNEGLWRGLNRCTGEFIGSCLADEELLPDAVERAVPILQRFPDVGAITGDAIITDLAGAESGFWKSGPFNFADYLLCDYTPYFVSSFFRRQALVDAGLKTETWAPNCVEFETWCRLATQSRVLYVAGANAKYASHAGQSSNNPRDVLIHFAGRLDQIAKICSAQGFMGDTPLLHLLFIWGHARAFINHAIAYERHDTARALYRLAKEAASKVGPASLDGVEFDERYGLRTSADAAWHGLLRRVPAPIQRVIGPDRLDALRRKMTSALIASRYDRAAPGASPWKSLRHGARDEDEIILPPAMDRQQKTRLYAHLASRYEANNRFREAADTWRTLARLNNLAGFDGNTVDTPGYTPKRQ
jgi:glycosyltransferase involved in cell wall biosynthesis